jgi:hypothetical protein
MPGLGGQGGSDDGLPDLPSGGRTQLSGGSQRDYLT